MDPLHARLEELLHRTDDQERLKGDPLWFAHQYTEPADQEVTALIASALAFGRVAAFWPVLERIFAVAHRRGGPRAWVTEASLADHRGDFADLVYRWVRAEDLSLFLAGLGATLRAHGSLGELFPAGGETVRPGLTVWVSALRAEIEALTGQPWSDQRRALKHLLPSPATGAACKRLNLFLRWMVRPADGVDLGLWPHVPSSALVIPLDTHVLRIARQVGLTSRKDGSWRTAEEITARLRAFDQEDPVRFDFALAHLGITGRCRKRECASCALEGACTAAPA